MKERKRISTGSDVILYMDTVVISINAKWVEEAWSETID
jgi:hypothetical protein